MTFVGEMPGQMKERLAGSAIKSITQPLLVLSIAFSLPALGVAAFLKGAALDVDLFLSVLFPALFGVTHVYFMVKDPDRLQSEDWRLRDRTLSIIETNKGVVSDQNLLEVSTSPTVVLTQAKTQIALAQSAYEDSDGDQKDQDAEIESK